MESLLYFLGVGLMIYGGIYLFFSGPERDRRYKTGYKDNLIPENFFVRVGKSIAFLFVGMLLFSISSMLGGGTETGTPYNKKYPLASDFVLFEKPNNKSKKIVSVLDTTEIVLLDSTKYFYEVNFTKSEKEYHGFIYREKLRQK